MRPLETHNPDRIVPMDRLILSGGKVACDAFEMAELNLNIRRGVIRGIRPRQVERKPSPAEHFQVNLEGCLVLPGLINAHDHLEFGLFPRLGKGPYPDAKSWALDIYRPEASPIRELLRISKPTRLFWGGLRNLFSGVTTVCHHNPYEEETFRTHFPVKVVDAYRWAHSLDFFPETEPSLRNLPSQVPFHIHLGEGTGERSRQEIYALDKMGLLDKRSILIHGVAFHAEEWELIRKRGASVIWCPSSNLFVLGKTLDLDYLSRGTPVGLGNDSPLTAEGDLLDEIRVAAQFGIAADTLYAMVTDVPAALFRLRHGEGKIRLGGMADLLIVTDTGESPARRLLSLTHRDIQLMIRGGQIVLASEQFVRRSSLMLPQSFQHVCFHNLDWYTCLDVRSRWNETHQILGSDFLFAGRNVWIS